MEQKKLIVSPSPHLTQGDSTRGIMADVLIALAPAALVGIFLFGLRALALLAVCVLSAVLSEYIACKILKRPVLIGDLSAVVTGLLLGMNLPVGLPFWMAALGSAIAIVVVKQLFGGIGQNFANPAITARIVLMVSFPAAMTTWREPFAWLNQSVDAVTGATPLAGSTEHSIGELFLGLHGGCIGETCCVLLLLGGLYLIFRGVIRPTIPLCFIGTFFCMTLLLGGSLDAAVRAVLSGGLLLGAIFMATDYATTPLRFSGHLIFGVGCGLLTFVIRWFGALPEGVSFSILLMNILTPLIDRITARKPFGWEAKRA